MLKSLIGVFALLSIAPFLNGETYSWTRAIAVPTAGETGDCVSLPSGKDQECWYPVEVIRDIPEGAKITHIEATPIGNPDMVSAWSVIDFDLPYPRSIRIRLRQKPGADANSRVAYRLTLTY